MKPTFQISIPEPCHENWQQMTAVEKGRFCGSCQKKVHDFTLSPDREILEKLNSDQHLCGRFNAAQLGRELYVPETKSALWLAAASGILGFMVIGTEAQAQVKQGEIVQTDVRSQNTVLGKPIAPLFRTIHGNITNERGEAIPAGNINIKGTSRSYTADMGGNFTIKAQPDEVLEFSFIGYETRSMTVAELEKNHEVKLSESHITMGVVVSSERPDFFRRMYNKARNIFR